MTLTSQIVQSLRQNPNQWNFGEFEAENTELGFSIWTANGIISMQISEPFVLDLNPISQFRIWSAIRYAKKKQLMDNLG